MEPFGQLGPPQKFYRLYVVSSAAATPILLKCDTTMTYISLEWKKEKQNPFEEFKFLIFTTYL